MSETVAGAMMLTLALAVVVLAGFGVQSCQANADSERRYRASEAYRDCVVSCSGGPQQ